MKIERRTSIAEILPSGDGMTFEGYAVRYNSTTYIGPPKRGFYERMAPSAFTRALRSNPDVVCTYNHNPNQLLARTSAGTLKLENRADGLWTSVSLPDTSIGRDVSVLTKRGDIRGMSFVFGVRPGGDEWSSMPGGHEQLRTVTDADIVDVGPVTFPAYSDTTASVRSQDGRPEKRDGVVPSDLMTMVAATDSCIDSALISVAANNIQQACANLAAAAVTIDQASMALWSVDTDLLTSLGLPDVVALVQAADSAIDAAYAACVAGSPAPDALTAAETAIDAVMVALNIPDPDDAQPLPGEPADEGAGERSALLITVKSRWLSAFAKANSISKGEQINV